MLCVDKFTSRDVKHKKTAVVRNALATVSGLGIEADKMDVENSSRIHYETTMSMFMVALNRFLGLPVGANYQDHTSPIRETGKCKLHWVLSALAVSFLLAGHAVATGAHCTRTKISHSVLSYNLLS